MKIIYTNISPVTKAYTNINHFFYLKKQKPQKVYLCVWDNFVYEHQLFEYDNEDTKKEKLLENVTFLENLMEHLGIDYKTIYLSDMWMRFFKSNSLSKIYQRVLTSINLNQIKKGFSLRYIPFGEINLSKINYLIVDYLIATHLPEIAPEICNSQPTHYLTSERFKIFNDDINHVLKPFSKYEFPKNIFVTDVPVLMHPKTKRIPSLEMSIETIKKIVDANYGGIKPDNKEIFDLFEILFSCLNRIKIKNKKISKKQFEEIITLNYVDLIEVISENFYKYFNEINRMVKKRDIKIQKKSVFISNQDEFHKQIKSLNKIKLRILKECDGTNSSLDVSKKTGLKLSTVSTYFNHLKNKNLIENKKRPKRLVDYMIINLDVMGD